MSGSKGVTTIRLFGARHLPSLWRSSFTFRGPVFNFHNNHNPHHLCTSQLAVHDDTVAFNGGFILAFGKAVSFYEILQEGEMKERKKQTHPKAAFGNALREKKIVADRL